MAHQKTGATAVTQRGTRSKNKDPMPAPGAPNKPLRKSLRIRGCSPKWGPLEDKRGRKSVVRRRNKTITRQSPSQVQEQEGLAPQEKRRKLQKHSVANIPRDYHQDRHVPQRSVAPTPIISNNPTYTERTERWVDEAPLPKSSPDWIAAMAMLPLAWPDTTARGRSRTGEPNGTPRLESDKASLSSKIESSGPHFADILSNSHPFVKSHMRDYDGIQGDGPNVASMDLWRKLRDARPSRLPDPRYDNKMVFTESLARLAYGNEAMLRHILHDIVCPPAGGLAARIRYDANLAPTLYPHYDLLADAMDELWYNSNAMFKTDTLVSLPKPGYCVGFRQWAFSNTQQRKLRKLTRHPQFKWNPTALLYFPFLTCEAAHKGSIEHGKQRNAYSMTLAIMAVVELFTVAQCKELLRREILGFSITYNETEVNLFCHYPDIQGDVTEIYRTRLRTFHYDSDFYEGRWVSYDIVRNIYEIWAPYHFKRLSTALDRCDDGLDMASLPSNARGTPTPSDHTSIAREMRVESDTSTAKGAERAASSTPVPDIRSHQPPPTMGTSGHLISGSTIGTPPPKDGSV